MKRVRLHGAMQIFYILLIGASVAVHAAPITDDEDFAISSGSGSGSGSADSQLASGYGSATQQQYQSHTPALTAPLPRSEPSPGRYTERPGRLPKTSSQEPVSLPSGTTQPLAGTIQSGSPSAGSTQPGSPSAGRTPSGFPSTGATQPRSPSTGMTQSGYPPTRMSQPVSDTVRPASLATDQPRTEQTEEESPEEKTDSPPITSYVATEQHTALPVTVTFQPPRQETEPHRRKEKPADPVHHSRFGGHATKGRRRRRSRGIRARNAGRLRRSLPQRARVAKAHNHSDVARVLISLRNWLVQLHGKLHI